MRAMINDDLVRAHRDRALSPDKPIMRGTAQNPTSTSRLARAVNPFTRPVGLVQRTMDELAELTGRHYHLFDYVGAADAERVIVMMGSGAEAAEGSCQVPEQRGERSVCSSAPLSSVCDGGVCPALPGPVPSPFSTAPRAGNDRRTAFLDVVSLWWSG